MTQATWGAIFDFDGVIINSAAQHEESWERLAAEIGKPLPPDHFERSFGMKNAHIIPNLLDWSHDPAEIERLSLRKEELYRIVVEEKGLEPIPGVVNFLEFLQRSGVPCVIGSSTQKLNITSAFQRLGIGHFFADMATSEDVTKGKPDPQVFLVAASKIQMPPQRCVVFEDAVVGVQAGKAAGMRVVAVTTTNPPEKLRQADLVVDRLDTIRPETWDHFFGRN